jgi:hypothetical protein
MKTVKYSSHRPVPVKTRHSAEADTHTPCGIGTPKVRKRAHIHALHRAATGMSTIWKYYHTNLRVVEQFVQAVIARNDECNMQVSLTVNIWKIRTRALTLSVQLVLEM